MVDEPTRTLEELAKSLGKYPEEAFLFIREGLSFASEHVHGEETDAHRLLQHYLSKNDIDWDDLIHEYHSGELPKSLMEVIDTAGGCESLNRHVSGRELCWALRDYALKRWGIMAQTVLGSWHVRSTTDFGRIVFAFIDFDMMRKQDNDTLEDFEDVFDFNEAFEEPPGRKLQDHGRNGNGKGT